MNNRTTIHICTKDRHSELALLLQSLRTQTYQDFDIIILDDASGSPIIKCSFLVNLINRLKLENHRVKLIRENNSFGCCYARNKCIQEDTFGNAYTFRCDDDVILKEDYIDTLITVIEHCGYDMASGVVPLFQLPEVIRDIKHVYPIINEHKLDDKGNLILNKDDCGYCYSDEKIIPTHQFRTNCLYKSEINSKINYPTNLTTVAFREEGFFSLNAILEGYTIAVDTGAICWHLRCQSGGNRRKDYQQCVNIDDETFRKWLKAMFELHGDFISKYNEKVLK